MDISKWYPSFRQFFSHSTFLSRFSKFALSMDNLSLFYCNAERAALGKQSSCSAGCKG